MDHLPSSSLADHPAVHAILQLEDFPRDSVLRAAHNLLVARASERDPLNAVSILLELDRHPDNRPARQTETVNMERLQTSTRVAVQDRLRVHNRDQSCMAVDGILFDSKCDDPRLLVNNEPSNNLPDLEQNLNIATCSRKTNEAGKQTLKGCKDSNEDDSELKSRRQLERVKGVKRENVLLKARQLCLHCRVRPVNLTLLPCGHFCYCMGCGATFNRCPICLKTVLADIKTILS